MPDPKLTVLTTVYNGERWLDECIESVLAQDFTDYEYVIVDDGSTDATPQILQRWSEHDPRIIIERIPRNCGIARALNRGLAMARGQYIGRQDADDICVGPRLRRQVELLDSDPDVVLVSSNYTMIDKKGRWAGNGAVENPPSVIAYLLNFSNAVGSAGGQGMFRANMARKMGGFREDFEVSVDYEFWTRLVQRGRIVILPFVGLKYRLHDQRISVRRTDLQNKLSLINSRRILTSYLNREVSDSEFTAVTSIWLREGRTEMAATGNRVLREAYARFAALEVNPRHRRRARLITAAKWFLSAMMLVKLCAFEEAALHFGHSLRWHPCGPGLGIAYVAERLFVRAFRGKL
jgi:glycosyltransferase involved in cell wall biosynthesis